MCSRPSPTSLVLACALAVSSCGKPTSGPLYQTVPRLEEIPTFAPLAMRTVPDPVRDELVLTLRPGSTAPAEDDYVNSPGAEAQEPGGRPSVIISVPLEATQAARRAAELRAQGLVPTATRDEPADAAALESFQTDGYYNQAEQQIETALIRRGFDVLDRARFEATLRDLRDRGDAAGRCRSEACQIAEAAGTDVARSRLEEQLKSGGISLEAYTETMDELNRRAERSTPGQRRTEDEMVDIAEVIRAAQSGSETSDYLLQISVVKVEPSFDREFSIDTFPETKTFLAMNPGLRLGNPKEGRLPPSIPSKWYRAEFNAKLMSIQTGSIVWLGNHTLESQHAQDMTIMINVERRVANGEAVTAALRDYNQRGDRLQAEAGTTGRQIQALYAAAQAPQQFENEEAMLAWEKQTRDRISQLERHFRDLREELVAHAANRPREFTDDFAYEYSVSDAIVTPNLTDFSESDRQAKEHLDEHRNNLIRAVTRSLIETIEVKR